VERQVPASARRRIPMSAEAQLSEPALEGRPVRFTTSSAAAEDLPAATTTDLMRLELNLAVRDGAWTGFSPRERKKCYRFEDQRIDDIDDIEGDTKAAETALGFGAQEFETNSERSANSERESCTHARLGKSYQLISVPASDDKGTFDHLAKYITDFFLAFRRF